LQSYANERNAPKKFEIGGSNQTERLSKRLSRFGICSRREAEKLIEQGMIKVDGKVITNNIGINDKKYKIKLKDIVISKLDRKTGSLQQLNLIHEYGFIIR
jgi:23S rRNA-/tRNA-specific pseudouridylate synthase